MKKLLASISSISLSLYLSIFPTAAHAADSCGKFVNGRLKLCNPLGNVNDIPTLAGTIIAALLGFVGSVALLMFIYGGFLWLTSGGSPERIKKGKDTLIWASIGLVFIFSSYVIANFVIRAITGQQ